MVKIPAAAKHSFFYLDAVTCWLCSPSSRWQLLYVPAVTAKWLLPAVNQGHFGRFWAVRLLSFAVSYYLVNRYDFPVRGSSPLAPIFVTPAVARVCRVSVMSLLLLVW